MYRTRVIDWLLADEISNNPFLSVVESIAAGKTIFGENPWLAAVEKNGFVHGCVCIVDPDGMVTTPLPEESWETVAQAVLDSGVQIDRINGPEKTSSAIGTLVGKATGRTIDVTHRWQTFQLESLVWPPSPAPGELRLATEADEETIEKWGVLYGEEKPAPVSIPAFLKNKVDEGDLYLWEHESARCLVAVSGRTNNCARVSAVFTPKENRGSGYAAIAVATVSQMLLNEGRQYCTLVVDVDDKHVMRIYERLGYEPIGSKASVRLVAT